MKKEAFTLIELLVVIGIMLVLAGLAMPAVAPLLRRNSLDAGAGLVVNKVYAARAAATVLGTDVTLLLDPATSSLNIVRRDGARLEAPEFLPPGVEFKLSGGDAVADSAGQGRGNSITWLATGNLDAASNGGPGSRVITLTDPARRDERRIEVSFATGLPVR